MANITVSTSSNFDDAANLGLLNGENITVTSDAVLTINSDVRWGQNAAVPHLITLTQGKLLIDGSQTWWIPFDASTGNVPALGTCGTPDVTRSGTNVGEFLGIWTALGVAPTASGQAIPGTGYLKLRSKSATLNDNDVLTFSNGATITINSATGGQRGWINFVGREAVSSGTGVCSIPRLGDFQSLGDWFVLGTSNGTSGQTFQHYVADLVPALQVETGNGTGIYEWWGCALAAEWNATVIATDDRGRYYNCSTTGAITFGGATFGKLPPNGARIRVPNVHISTAPSTDYSINTLSAAITNRYAFLSTGGNIDATYLCCNGSFGSSNSPLYKVTNSCGADGAWRDNGGTNTNISQTIFNNVAASRVVASNTTQFSLTYSFNAEFTNCASFRTSGATGASSPMVMSNVTNLVIDGYHLLMSGVADSMSITYCNGVTMKNSLIMGVNSSICSVIGCTDLVFSNIGITSKSSDSSAITAYGFSFNNCNNVLVDTIYLWQGAVFPVLSIFNVFNQTKNIRIRNIGSRTTPITLGSGTRYVISITNSTDIIISKVYAGPGSQGSDSAISISNCDNFVVSDIGDPTNTSGQMSYAGIATNTTFFKRSATGGLKNYNTVAGNGRTLTSFTAFGTHFAEEEVSSTEVQLTIYAGTEKSTYQSSIDAYTDDVGTILRGGTNDLLLRNLNDQVTWTWNYWIRGLTGFVNTNAVISGTNTGNFEITYDLDKGQGFSGIFKAATGANLSSETGISASGVKLRVRAKCTTASSTNIIRAIGIYGSTTASNLANNPYPYNEPLIRASGPLSGTTAAVFRNSDSKLLDVKSGSSIIDLYPEWFSDTACTLRIRKPGYDAITSEFTHTENGLNYPVSQFDNTIANTDPGSLGITVTNHGASPVTWNGKQYSITITVTDSSTPAQIAQWISWHTAQNTFTLGAGVNNMAWPAMIIPAGTSFETQRGTLFGSAGTSLKGVRIVDGSGNGIAGFTRFQADDGTYYQPPVSATFELTNLKNNTEIRVYKVSDMSELAGQENVTTGTFSYSYVWSTDIPVLVSIVSIGYQNLQLNSTLTATGTSIPISQVIDRQYLNP
jgi:hypothetical protein